MRSALAAKPVVDFPKPDTVVTVAADPATGRPATAGTPSQREELYIAKPEPAEPAPEQGTGSSPAPSAEGTSGESRKVPGPEGQESTVPENGRNMP